MNDDRARRLKLAGVAAGILASTIGVVAVFFPDLLNLERKRFSSFERDLTSRDDAKELEAFLEANRGKLAKLALTACGNSPEWMERVDEGFHVRTCSGPDDCETQTSFYFKPAESTPDKPSVWDWNKMAECKLPADEYGTMSLSGYYLVPDSSGYGMGVEEWILEEVAEKDIRLKEY